MTRGKDVSVAAAVVALLSVAGIAGAQGKGKGPPKGHPPGQTPVPAPVQSAPVAPADVAGAVPFAWIDTPSLLPRGVVSASIAVLRWAGTGASETDVPVVSAAAGVGSRLQLAAMLPRIVPDVSSGLAGGIGTSFAGAKIALTTARSAIAVSVSPTIEVLSGDALAAFPPGEGRLQAGMPVSIGTTRGPVCVFGSAGGFTPGIWFAGGGVSAQASPRVAFSATMSDAWTTGALAAAVGVRREATFAAAISATPHVMIYGTYGRTFATDASAGAGTTISAGLVFATSVRTSNSK